MRTTPASTELSMGLYVLLGIQLLTTLGAITLLGRISPAVESIRRENVFSVEAVEEMLEALARRGQPGTSDAALERQFERALARAQGNVTEKEEHAPLAVLAEEGKRAFQGDQVAHVRVVDALRTLSHINHEAAGRVDHEVKQLGTAGAWAATFVGAFAFIFGVLVLRRGQRRLLDPLDEAVSVIVGWQAGDPLRRCTPERWGPEWRTLMSAVNRLLDERDVLSRARASGPSRDALAKLARTLIEREPNPAAVVDREGDIQASNAKALALLESDEGEAFRDQLRRAGSGESQSELRTEPVPGTNYVLCIRTV